jgi:hypothetical protein
VLTLYFFVTTGKVLIKAQRKLLKTPKRMVIGAKAQKIVEYIHEHITNNYEDSVKKVSLNPVKAYYLMTFEDLNVRGTIKEQLSSKAYS